jgi:uncharacterized membrane protein
MRALIQDVADLVARLATAAGHGIARHWLGLMVLVVGGFLGLAIAAPLLSMFGHDRAADLIYMAYRLTCHQLPHRSWFIGGESLYYDWPTVQAYLGPNARGIVDAFHHPIRDPILGYQMAFCQRDTGIYAGLLLTTMLFGVVRSRRHVPPLPFKLYLLALVPIGIDGLTQLVGLRESTPITRTLTGMLFGAATALLVLPQLEIGFRELDEGNARRAAEGAGAASAAAGQESVQ